MIISPRNLTKKSQDLDININEKAKNFVSHKFNMWRTESSDVSFPGVLSPLNVKVSMKLSELKLFLARRMVELNILQNEKAAK